MLGLSTTQLLLLAAGAVALLFTKSPGGGLMDWVKKLLGGGGVSSDPIQWIIQQVVHCEMCSPEEEKQLEDALLLIARHAIRHRLRSEQKPEALAARVAELEAMVTRLTGTQV